MRRLLALVAAMLLVGSAPAAQAAATPARNDFSLSIGPTTVTVKAGRPAHYTIMLHRGSRFYARIGLSVSALPRGVTAGFTPFGAGFDPHRTLLVDTRSSARSGRHRLAVRASGGGHVHVRYVYLTVHH